MLTKCWICDYMPYVRARIMVGYWLFVDQFQKVRSRLSAGLVCRRLLRKCLCASTFLQSQSSPVSPWSPLPLTRAVPCGASSESCAAASAAYHPRPDTIYLPGRDHGAFLVKQVLSLRFQEERSESEAS